MRTALHRAMTIMMTNAKPPTELPAFYNDLDAARLQAFNVLARGAKDRRSGMHTFSVATIGRDGAPQVRTVVNRGFDQDKRMVRFHTDRRSSKLAEFAADPRVAAHFYDSRAKIQLRLATTATIHADDALKHSAWGATRDFSRECYRVDLGPGTPISDPQSLFFSPGEDTDEGAENFVAVTLHVHALEWLYLAHQGHRRARFVWDDAGTISQEWLVP